MAEQHHARRRALNLGIGLALVIGAVAALVWGGLSIGARHGGASQPTVAVTTTPSAAPTSKPPSASAPEPTVGPLTVVALGDSVPAAGTCDCAAYPDLLGALLHRSTGRAVAVRNDANGGWTTSDVESDLTSAKTSTDLSNANLVVVEVGANDFDLSHVDDPGCLPAASSACWAPTLQDLSTELSNIVAGIRREDSRPDVRIALVGYWNVTLDGDVGQAEGQNFVTGSDALTRAVNLTIHNVAGATHATYVDAYTPFKNDPTLSLTSALLDDGDHLSAKGHTIMAATIMAALTQNGVVADLTTAR